MPWGYRGFSAARFRSGPPRSVWNTAGETASLKNACKEYDLTEEEILNADPPIPRQWRSCHGNSYAVVKLSDIAALRNRIDEQEELDAIQKLKEELGEEGYAKKVAEDEAREEKEKAVSKLVPLLEVAMAASGHGIADTLEGKSITKTAAKSEWYVKPEELERLNAVDPTKKQLKYHLADVIGMAHNKSTFNSTGQQHISTRVKSFPDRQKLYARYLHDQFNAQCKKVDDDEIVQSAYDKVRNNIEKDVSKKAEAVKKAQEDLKVEETRLSAFDDLVNDMKLISGEKRSSASNDKENESNGTKNPLTKKRKLKK